MEKARKEGESIKTTLVTEAQGEAKKIVQAGHQALEMEKGRTMDEVKAKAVHLIVLAAEKLLREKIDESKDAKMIEENLKSYPA